MSKPYPTVDDLYMVVGKCLHAWSNVELNLSMLFMALNDHPRDNHHLRAAFDAVQSLEVRLSMIHATIIHDPRNSGIFTEKWNSLYNKISRTARKRAQVAHFTIIAHSRLGRPETATLKLQPFFTLTSMMTNASMLTYDQLCIREQSFRRLASRIIRFCRYLWIVRQQFPEYDEPTIDPVHLLDAQFSQNPTDNELPLLPIHGRIEP